MVAATCTSDALFGRQIGAEVTEPVLWDTSVPPGLRRVLQDLVESADPEDGGPLEVLAGLLNVPTPPESGYDARLWIRGEIERLDAKRV
jgi:hypothetical protein